MIEDIVARLSEARFGGRSRVGDTGNNIAVHWNFILDMDLQGIVNFGPRSELYSRTRSAAKRIHPVISEAYGDYEQHMGFMTALEEQFAFPFSAKVMGEILQVTGME